MKDKISDFLYCVIIVAIMLAVAIGVIPDMVNV